MWRDLTPEAQERFAKRRRMYLVMLAEVIEIAARTPGFDGDEPIVIDHSGPDKAQAKRNLREHPLDLMLHKGQITMAQYSAGDVYRTDHELSQITPLSARSYQRAEFLADAADVAAAKRKVITTAAGVDMLGPRTFAPHKAGKQPFVWRDVSHLTLDAMQRVNKATAALRYVGDQDLQAVVMARDGRTPAQIAERRLLARRGLSRVPHERHGDTRAASLEWLASVKLEAVAVTQAVRKAREIAESAEVVTRLCRDRQTIADMAALGAYGNRNRVGQLVQAGLDRLAQYYGFMSRGRRA
jgi:hypothetical protein